MRSRLMLLATAALLLGACGGGSTEPETAAPTVVATPTAEPTPAPDEVAFADTDVILEGDTGVLVTAGETVAVDHLVLNAAGNSRSLAFRVDVDDDSSLEVELSAESSRLKAGEIESLVSTVTVPTDVAVGQVLEYGVVVVNVEDVRERSETVVQLLVTDAVGSRPEAGPDAGVTATNERVLVYVVGDDVDPDDDLDISSVRVIGGGFSADRIQSDGNGTITYVPFANLTGEDVLVYEICDLESRCDTALITITVDG